MRSLASSSPWARYADSIAISTCVPHAVFAIASAPNRRYGRGRVRREVSQNARPHHGAIASPTAGSWTLGACTSGRELAHHGRSGRASHLQRSVLQSAALDVADRSDPRESESDNWRNAAKWTGELRDVATRNHHRDRGRVVERVWRGEAEAGGARGVGSRRLCHVRRGTSRHAPLSVSTCFRRSAATRPRLSLCRH
jgi:hypothetical protein